MDGYLIKKIKELIINAGDIAIKTRQNNLKVEWKQDNTPVTNADKEISLFIFNALSILTPDIPVICEERERISIDKNKKFWLIDPIDGTKSFIDGRDSFTINIALIDNQIASFGFIYQPTARMLYFTDENKKFVIEKNQDILEPNVHNENEFVAVVSSHHFNQKTKDYLKNNGISKIISMPSSLKLCMIAEGVADIYPKFGTTMEWDIAAGHALINANGGKLSIHSGEEILYGKDHFENSNFIAISRNISSSINTLVI
ncbi:3'(2'),5'-bisphosphate nucleotidase CysQ [Rickettsiaceae bacterium]|nr:3'(2'),5'-bisphosphate nucleotidase CysQ [Rickettsiaceae bacterium]